MPHEGVPIRADMATIVPGPIGMVESELISKARAPLNSAMYNKRKDLKGMLVDQLVKRYDADQVTRMVIAREVEGSPFLNHPGKLSTENLARLEQTVAAAVRAMRPEPMQERKPPPNRYPPIAAKEMAAAVDKVANWTEVAQHRAGYYMIEQQRKTAEFEQRKKELHVKLHHQMRMEQSKELAAKQAAQREAAEIAADLKAFREEGAAKQKAREAKSEQQRADRRQQLREKEARAAAAVRLQQLEDVELLAHLQKEEAKAQERKAEKARANAEYHRATAAANIAAREQREVLKQQEWAEEQRLNATWKAVLDEQEAARTNLYEGLREKIRRMQRNYESNAGAEDEARLKAEEATRNKWIAMEDARLEALDKSTRAKRKAMIDETSAFNQGLLRARDAAAKKERDADKAFAAECRADAAKELEREAHKKALREATSRQQQHYLNEQVILQREQAARDPGASEMTDLERTLNRSLLVSIVQHQYPSAHVLN